MTVLVQQDYQQPNDNKGMRRKARPADLRSGTLFAQYQLRGSILVIKDSLTATSGFIAFGTDMTTIPTSAATGTGLYIDYTGFRVMSSNVPIVTQDTNGITIVAAEAVTDTPRLKWITASGQTIGLISSYYNTGAGDLGFLNIQALGTTSGDEGRVTITASNKNETKLAFFQVRSSGKSVLDLTDGKANGVGVQNLEILTESSDNTQPTIALALTSTPTTAHADGFGTRLYLQADGQFQGSIQGEFTGGGNNSNLKIQAQNAIRFAQGATPNVTGSRGGNAALASLLTILAATGLITDGSS
jgi:hypothetical protein